MDQASQEHSDYANSNLEFVEASQQASLPRAPYSGAGVSCPRKARAFIAVLSG